MPNVGFMNTYLSFCQKKKKKYLSILEISENNRRENNRYNQGWIQEFSKGGPNYLSIYLNIVIINKTHRLNTIVRKTFDTLVTN